MRQHTTSRIRIIIYVVIGVALAACITLWLWLSPTISAPAPQLHQPGSNTIRQDASVKGLESRILFAGDIFLGRAVHKTSQASSLKEAYPFSRLSEFNREEYDGWVANLECPSVPGADQPYALEAGKLMFNCPTIYLAEAAKWFTAFSLANNHTSNQGGQKGLDATRSALQDNAIQYFGHYDPRILEDICEVVAMPARLQLSNTRGRKTSIPFALCGYHGLAVSPSAEALAVMLRYSRVMPVVAYPHMGTEYVATPDPARRKIYQAMIDNGADAVLGAHPHWVQPAEVYKDKLIVYPMGNFIFDQERGETQRGAAIDLTLKVDKAVSTKQLTAWAELASTCTSFRDDCLMKAEQQKITRPSLLFEYTARGVDLSDKLTRPANTALNDAVMERLNWTVVSKQLGQAGQ